MKQHPKYGRRGMTSLYAALAVMAVLTGTAAAGSEGVEAAIGRSPLTVGEKHDLTVRAQAAVRAGVPAEDVEIIVARSLSHGADAAATGRFLDTASRVSKEGLPVKPIVDRIEQGLSKGIPPDRINAASGRLADGLAKAKPLVDGLLRSGLSDGARGARAAAIESVARAGEQSIPDNVLRATGERVRVQGRTLQEFDQAVRSLTFLAGSGMPLGAAEQLVLAGAERGFTERDYAGLERSVSDMVRQGRSMDDIVRAAERDMLERHGDGAAGGTHDREFGGSRESGGRGSRGR